LGEEHRLGGEERKKGLLEILGSSTGGGGKDRRSGKKVDVLIEKPSIRDRRRGGEIRGGGASEKTPSGRKFQFRSGKRNLICWRDRKLFHVGGSF